MEEYLERCPVCKNKLKQNYVRTEDYANRYHINCQYCGRYELYGWRMKSRFLHDRPSVKINKSGRLLSIAIRHKYEETGKEVLISESTIDDLRKSIPIPENLLDKVDILLIYMLNKTKYQFEDNISIQEYDYPLMRVISDNELNELILLANKLNFITFMSKTKMGDRICSLTQHGWNRIQQLTALKEIRVIQKDRQSNTKTKKLKCFIVLGRDKYWNRMVKEYLDSIKIDYIVLSDKENEGNTVIEKFECHAQVDFAVCIWSPDDEGKMKGKSVLKPRIRQNVMLETGFFWGSLGRKKVFILNHKNVEIPSDFAGLVYISLCGGNWKSELLKEIERLKRG
ncbi:MAG: nucleotide-binding protein [Candidatus Cloacimonetes bacterium]|nr:nucleotide-binding protein [Candidatus Cloacimonadota bacterium]MDY0367275.1 nucleotide-binding protein [Candidatus Syntrophosphaera sp.]